MGPFIKMIWFVAFAIFALLVLEIVLFVGMRQERESYKKEHRVGVICR